MKREKRKGEPPIPANYPDALSPDQMMTLRQISNFGWDIAFVRRSLFEENVVVVSSADRGKIGILENDGQLNLQAEIRVREHAL